MLKKLLKYEIPSVGRKLLPLYGALMVAAILLGLSLRFSRNSVLYSDASWYLVILIMLYTIVATAVVVMTFVMIIQRFMQNLLGDGGYFSLSLPVTIGTHLWNKTISAGLWTVFAGIAGGLSGLLILLLTNAVDLSFFAELFTNGAAVFLHALLFLIEALALAFASGCKTALQIYLAITAGHQVNRHRGLCGFGAYCAIVTIEGMIGSIAINTGFADAFMSILPVDGVWHAHLVLFIVILISAAFSAVYFAICRSVLSTRLNLQ